MPRTNRLAKHVGPIGLITAATAGALGFAGCSDGEEAGVCISTEQYFAEQVWAPILSQKCIACHNPTGLAKDSKLVLRNSSEAGFIDANLAIVREVASFEQRGRSLLLLKPTNSIQHGGGVQVTEGSAEYASLQTLAQRLKTTDTCETSTAGFFAEVEMLGWERTLRKAALAVAGRLPTEEEAKAVRDGGEPAFDAVLDKYMTEDVFFERIKQFYNDEFLTDKYMNEGEDALGFLESDGDGPTYNPRWYENAANDPSLVKFYGANGTDDLQNKLRSWTRRAVAREPVELVAYVVKQNRPFTEIVTAPYTIVNPFSAKAWNVTDVQFDNPADPNEWREGYRGGYESGFPHAGVLTSTMFLVRHPTTPTNRNRHRARMVYQYFLGTDILKTAEQPLDPTKITDFNPTMNNAACTVCHANIDPVAGAFHSFDDLGRYMPEDTWLTDMRPPGFGREIVPYEEFPTSIQWLGQRVAEDPRFALAAVYVVYTGLTGQKPMLAPTDTKAPGFSDRFKGYLAQYATFNKIAKDFQASNYNLKTVFRGVIKSPYFRAVNAQVIDGARKQQLGELGTAQVLIPEQLNRKIFAITGYPWRSGGVDGRDVLMDRRDGYHMLFGGIDSSDVVTRVRDLNGVMANIVDRMGNEMSCLAVPRDFALPKEQRRLFKLVETTFEPKDANGFEVVPATKAIKEQIQLLHRVVLDEHLELDDPEIERTYELFVTAWQAGNDGMKRDITIGDETRKEVSRSLPWPCQVREDYWTEQELPEEEQLTQDENFTLRAWMGVMSYMLTDYSFVHE